MRPWLLILRFLLVNSVAVGLVTAIWLQGWLDAALSNLTIWLVTVIALVFLFGYVICLWKVWIVSRDLTAITMQSPPLSSRPGRYLAAVEGQAVEERSLRANLLRLSLTNDVSIVRHVANMLVFLGLIGTVIGFIVALSGVDPESVSSADKVAPMISTLITGMSIALYTTLIGAVLHIWLSINHRMLSQGAIALFELTVDQGERRVGSR